MDYYPNLMQWKQQLEEKPLLGCFVTLASGDVAEMTARMGFDFLVIDNEHGVMEQSTLCDMVRASQCVRVPAVVRCTSNTYDHIQKALDFGANGVQIPLVNTRADAERAVSLSHYPPEGKRGTSYLIRAAGYGDYADKQEYLERANRTKLLSVHIETLEALDNLDEILAVDGIDVYFVGPGDLSASMALPVGHPLAQEKVKETIERIAGAGKIAGTYCGTAAEALQAAEWGARYLVTSVNTHMAEGARQFMSDVRR